MKSINNSLNWFGIPVLAFERTRKFYGKIYDFDISFLIMGADKLGFFPVEPKHIGGVIIKNKSRIPSLDGTLVYLNTGDDLNEILGCVEKAGGKSITSKKSISPGHGFFALFQDTEGNKVALHSMQ